MGPTFFAEIQNNLAFIHTSFVSQTNLCGYRIFYRVLLPIAPSECQTRSEIYIGNTTQCCFMGYLSRNIGLTVWLRLIYLAALYLLTRWLWNLRFLIAVFFVEYLVLGSSCFSTSIRFLPIDKIWQTRQELGCFIQHPSLIFVCRTFLL